MFGQTPEEDIVAEQVVWITGASSGIGEALARQYANAGSAVILTARRREKMEALAASLPKAAEVLILPADLCEADQVQAAAEAAQQWKGHIDLLINNAGVSQRGFVSQTPLEVDRRVFEINYFAVVALTKAVLPSMLERGQGHLVVVSSVAGHVSTPLRSSYAAAKHAIRAFYDALRAEVSSDGVSVTVVSPGYISTGISRAALTPSGEAQGTLDANDANGMDVDLFAQKMVKALSKKEREVLIGGAEVYAVYLKRWFPGILARLLPRALPK